MVEERTSRREERVEQLRHLVKTDPDPRVRRRAHGVLLVEQGHSLAQVARFLGTAAHRVRVWQDRFVAAGRAGLADQARGGRPPKLDAAARDFVSAALEQDPHAYGFPVTIWTLRDLQTLLVRERGVQVSVATLYRVVHTWATAIGGRGMTCATGKTPTPWRPPNRCWTGSKKNGCSARRSTSGLCGRM